MTGPDPAVAAVRGAVRAALADLPRGSLVLVACSGGADSTALAAGAAFVGPRGGLRVGAVVVDHGLQQGSEEVAERAALTCRELGLGPVDVVRVLVVAAGGPEAAARTARYAALEDSARAHGAAAVLLGHTRDDQAETVLLALARGSGARSLAGMPARRGVLRRPLLDLRRVDTERACAAQGLAVWHDPTNQSGPGAPRRSEVRHRVLPLLEEVLGPGVTEALARTADQLREDADHLDAAAHALLDEARVDEARVDQACGDGAHGGHGGAAGLDPEVLLRAPAALRRRVLRVACLEAGVPAGSLHRVHVLAVEALVVAWRGQGPVALPGGGEARRRCGRLTVTGPARPG
ncbi:tRNA lysidine(34) synthetase TilS [Actinotalea sp. BY-33]|uniref:tRNA(Ile)-lysidine synthase n=1 Tax=Actinotalea soli TaxID=2819234 RepID=A0A939LSD1_9CELL|nr:tRNA lysidine(34) synthetase TilS [Actinotalea soli]MBO1752988.1 tRNA lysidine(34) synthetase TilS [Actinotalea soli]